MGLFLVEVLKPRLCPESIKTHERKQSVTHTESLADFRRKSEQFPHSRRLRSIFGDFGDSTTGFLEIEWTEPR